MELICTAPDSIAFAILKALRRSSVKIALVNPYSVSLANLIASSSDLTTKVYRLVDGSQSAVTTNTVLADGSDTGTGTGADDGDIAVAIKVTATQRVKY